MLLYTSTFGSRYPFLTVISRCSVFGIWVSTGQERNQRVNDTDDDKIEHKVSKRVTCRV